MPKCTEVVYLVGLNSDMLEVVALLQKAEIRVESVLNDYYKESIYEGIPIIRANQANLNYDLINCSSSISPVKTQKHFLSLGFNVHYFADFVFQLEGRLPERFQRFSNNLTRIRDLKGDLVDQLSQQHFSALTGYRSTGDLEYSRQNPSQNRRSGISRD